MYIFIISYLVTKSAFASLNNQKLINNTCKNNPNDINCLKLKEIKTTSVKSTEITTSTTFPTSNFNQSTIENINSISDSFELTKNGLISKETLISNASTTFKTVTFTKNDITITETNGFSSTIPLYFIASKENSKITIAKNVKNSNIGISSENSPTVFLSKSDNPISFMNNKTKNPGNVTIDLLSGVGGINLNNVDNYNGDFTIYVTSKIESVAFKTLSMFKKSSFSIKDTNSNSIIAKVENVSVNSNCEVNLQNIELSGTISIYDDSILIVNENLTFSENSKIKLYIQRSQSYVFGEKMPLIMIWNELTTKPQSITLSNTKEINNLKVSNLPIIAASTFENCEKWNDIIKLEDSESEISTVCKEIDGTHFLLLDIKNENRKWLVIGTIVAIAAFIMGVTIYMDERMKEKSLSSEDSIINQEI